MDKLIDHFQVTRSYLAANEAKKRISSANNKINMFEDVLSLFNNKEDEKLVDLVTDKDRLKRLTGHSWFEKEVELKYVGSWPQIGDLEKDWCQGSVLDVAHQIAIHRNSGKKQITQIYEMIPIIDEVLALLSSTNRTPR